MLSKREAKRNIVNIINNYNKNDDYSLESLERYVKNNEIVLKELNDNTFDILLYAINSFEIINKNNVSLININSGKFITGEDYYKYVKLINFIIQNCQYETLNYTFYSVDDKGKPFYLVPIFSAIAKCKFRVADLLIKNGADINYTINCTIKNENYCANILFYLFNMCNINSHFNNKIVKYVLNNNFKVNNITSDIINRLIFKKNESLIEVIFKHYIFNNDFILELLSIYKNRITLSNEDLKNRIMGKENEIINDSMYDTAVKWGRCKAIKILLDYDRKEQKDLYKIVEKYQLLEKAVTFSSYELLNKVLSYKTLDLSHIDYEKLIISLGCNPKGESMLKLLLDRLLNDDPSVLNNINLENVLIQTRIYGYINILEYLMEKIILKTPLSHLENADISNIKNKDSTCINVILNVAITMGNFNLVQYLMENEELKSKIDINVKVKNDNYPIIVALYADSNEYFKKGKYSDSYNQLEYLKIFKYLLDKGIDSNLYDEYENSLFSMVIHTRNYNMTKLFLQKNYIVKENEVDDDYDLSFIQAIYNNSVDIIKSLVINEIDKIKKKSDKNITKNKLTPLIFSYLLGYRDIFEILLNCVDINEKDGLNNNILYYAILKEDTELVEYLSNNGVSVNFGKYINSALDISLQIGHKDIFNILLKNKNIILNEINNHLETPFSVIIKSPYFLLEDKIVLIEKLIDRGFNVNCRDGYGKSALICAVEKTSLPLVKVLISRGADVNYTYNSMSVLACAIKQKSFLIVKELVDNGANVNCLVNDLNAKTRYNDNIPTLVYAINIGELSIIKFLIEHNAVIELKNKYEYCGLIESICKKGMIEVFEYFKNNNLNIFSDEIVKTLLWEERYDLLKVLIPKYIDINYRDENGNTLIANAIISGSSEMVNFLEDFNVNFECINYNHETLEYINKKYNYIYNNNNYMSIEKILKRHRHK